MGRHKMSLWSLPDYAGNQCEIWIPFVHKIDIIILMIILKLCVYVYMCGYGINLTK